MSDEVVADVPAIPAPPTGNTAMRALITLGVIAMVIGAVVGFSANAAAKNAEHVNLYVVAMAGPSMAGDPAIDAAYGWMWFGIILAILGALMLIAALVVSASRQHPA